MHDKQQTMSNVGSSSINWDSIPTIPKVSLSVNHIYSVKCYGTLLKPHNPLVLASINALFNNMFHPHLNDFRMPLNFWVAGPCKESY